MRFDRRAMLGGLVGAAVAQVYPRPVAAMVTPERFAAARKDDRGAYSAALFDMEHGDIRSVALPGRGHAD